MLVLGVRRDGDADVGAAVDGADGTRRPPCRFAVELAGDGAPDGTLPDGFGAAAVVDSTRNGCGGLRTLPARLRRRTLPARTTGAGAALPSAAADAAAAALASSSLSSSSDTQRSQRIQPTKVAKLLQLTTDTGDTRSWYMPTKQTMKMVTEQTCWRMTVESATSGQKSYGLRRGLRWRFSRNVAWSV